MWINQWKSPKKLSEEKAKNDILVKEKNNSSCNCTNTTNVIYPCEGCKVLEVKVEYLLKLYPSSLWGETTWKHYLHNKNVLPKRLVWVIHTAISRKLT